MSLMRQLLAAGAAAGAMVIPATPVDALYSSVALLAEFKAPLDKSQFAYNLGLQTNEEAVEGIGREARALWIPTLPNSNTTQRQAVQVIDTTFPNLGTADFTVECWVKRSSEPAQGCFIGRWGTSTYFSWRFYWDATNNRVSFQFSTDGTTSSGNQSSFDIDTDGVSNLWNGEWHHIAAVRTAGVVKVYVDGIVGTTTIAIGSASIFSSTGRVSVGAFVGAGTGSLGDVVHDTYIDDVRITIGTARYTAAFTPPEDYATGVGDPYWNDTKLLLNFEDDFGASWVSPSGKVLSVNQRNNGTGNPLIVSKGLETYFNQNTFYTFAPVTNWSMGSGDFCIELFGVELKTSGSIRQYAGAYSTAGTRSWRIAQTATGLAFVYSTDGTAETTVLFGSTLSTGVSYNLCVERTGTTLRLFVNGTQTATATMSGTVFASTTPWLSIGARANGFVSANEIVDGYLRAIRYTLASRYGASSYTVPSLPLPRA